MKYTVYASLVIGILFLACCNRGRLTSRSGFPPNMLVIYCDDLGFGDLGCFGNEVIRTPNIDRLAGEGMRFTEFYSASPVCSPSRAALLTGRIPQRMGINAVFFPRSFTGMPVEEITIADLLKEREYATGLVGKWHLGHHHPFLPLQRGFDEYFGIPYSNDMESVVYLEGNEVVDFHVDQRFITQTYTEKACDFIEKHSGEPFFLYLAHSMPHVPIYASPEFEGRSGKGLYTDVIEEIDWSVGQLIEKLKEQGVLDRTLVVFSSDNGPWLVMREMGGSAGVLREGKQYTFEGGQRVPTLAMWQGVIPAGSVYGGVALMMDWFPTFAEIAGVDLPVDRDYDGESLLPLLQGGVMEKAREFLYFDGARLEGYRNGDWKLKLPFEGYPGSRGKKAVPAHDTLLFNLRSDPGEQVNLLFEYPGKAAEMVNLMEAFRESKGTFPESLDIGYEADHAFYDSLLAHHGKGYFRGDWLND